MANNIMMQDENVSNLNQKNISEKLNSALNNFFEKESLIIDEDADDVEDETIVDVDNYSEFDENEDYSQDLEKVFNDL